MGDLPERDQRSRGDGRGRKKAARKTMAVTGLEPEDSSSGTPTDSTWVWVFAPSLLTFVRDIAGLKTPGRPVRRRVETVNSDDMTEEDPVVMEDVEAMDLKLSGDTSSPHPDLFMVWGAHMARNWNKVRSNLLKLGKGVTEWKETTQEGLNGVDQELSSIANKIALLDTRIGVHPTASGIVSVWEAVEDVILDGGMMENKLLDVEKQ
jgi:hypothetical protein